MWGGCLVGVGVVVEIGGWVVVGVGIGGGVVVVIGVGVVLMVGQVEEN